MNIKVTYNWLLEFLDTDANPYEIQKYLSLCGPSVERVEKTDNDYILDIEVTSNRVDTASVYGIARECAAILPQFNKKATLKELKISYNSTAESGNRKLMLKISDPQRLCNRLTAVVMDNVKVGELPDFMKERLVNCGIRSLNNLIDITNYVMLETGQPTHVFDYDRIKTGKLMLRKAKKGEEYVALDDKVYDLMDEDVVIEDGTGRIIDLPGIMGAANSVVTRETKRIVFFMENNKPVVIRKTSMRLGLRTMAATINEKSPDPELPKTALYRGIELYQKYSGAEIAGQIYDIYPKKYVQKTISVSLNEVDRIIGVKIPKQEIVKILQRLGFAVSNSKTDILTVKVPSHLAKEVNIKEDLIEEIARVYGYFRLPSSIQDTKYIKQPKEVERLFEVQSKIKHFLKDIGLHEVMNYSMISKEMIENSDLKTADYLVLKNAVSEDIKYMRIHLIPSLIKNVKENEGKTDTVKFFEIAKTYKPRKHDLPVEEFKLGIIVNSSYFDLKGIIDALLGELNIFNYKIGRSLHPLLSSNIRGSIKINTDSLGEFGQLKEQYRIKNKVKSNVFLAVFDFKNLIKYYRDIPKIKPINPYATVKLDLTIELNSDINFESIKEKAFKTLKLLQEMEVLDTFKNKITIRFYFSSDKRNIKEEEAKDELETIKNLL